MLESLFNKIRLPTLLKRDTSTGVFQWPLQTLSIRISKNTRLAFSFFWNIKLLYFTYFHSYSFLLSLAVIHCHSLSFFVNHCHPLPLSVIHFHLLYHLLSLVVTSCTTRYHSLSLIVPLVLIRCPSLSFAVPLVIIRCNSMYHSSVFS